MPTSAVAASTVHAAPHKGLVKAADGDYTADSVRANPGASVGTKQSDGDYAPPGSAAAKSSPSVQSALSLLKLGG